MSHPIILSVSFLRTFSATNWNTSMKALNRKATFGSWLVGVLLLFSQNAQAGFVIPSYAGQPHSTSSTWNYNGDWAVGDSASHLTSPFTTVGGTYPLTTQDLGCGPGMPCLNNNNVFPDRDNLTFYVPNFVDPLSLKLLRIQFKFVSIPNNPNFPDPFVTDVNGFDSTGFVPGQLQLTTKETDMVMTDGVFYSYALFDFTIRPNPDYERFTISRVAGAELKEVRIDTISIPEPATLLLVSVAILGIGFSRRSA